MIDVPKFYPIFKNEIENINENPDFSGICYIRLEKEIHEPLDILRVTSSYDIPELLFFKDKNSINQFGGLDSSLVIKDKKPEQIFPKLNRILDIDKRIRLFGGFSFSHDYTVPEEWKDFNNCRFTLPFIEIHKKGKNSLVILNFYSESNPTIKEIKSHIKKKLLSIDSRILKSKPAGRFESDEEILIPEKEEWVRIINNSLKLIKEKKIEKIVLSRKKIIRNKNFWNLYAILNKLNNLREESFLFFYKINSDLAFLGRSPERLFKIKKNTLTAEAIAGTRPRGIDPRNDKMWEEQLISSPKELEEHRIVSRFIKERMGNFCTDLKTIKNESVLKLQNLQHIITQYSGTIKNNLNFQDIINSFHPSPAVGGHPQATVHKVIPRLEPYHRGWYAAPIGWIRKGEGNFAVAIRSALINGKDLHIYAGAGIVLQSDPRAEWNETDNKMDNFLNGLGEL